MESTEMPMQILANEIINLKDSGECKSLNTALLAALNEINEKGIAKTGLSPFGTKANPYKFSTKEDILNCALPILVKYKILLTERCALFYSTEMKTDMVIVSATLTHVESGEERHWKSVGYLPSQPVRENVQRYGGAVTYAERRLLCMIFLATSSDTVDIDTQGLADQEPYPDHNYADIGDVPAMTAPPTRYVAKPARNITDYTLPPKISDDTLAKVRGMIEDAKALYPNWKDNRGFELQVGTEEEALKTIGLIDGYMQSKKQVQQEN